MLNKDLKKPCPTCGQTMKFIKTEKQPKKIENSSKENNVKDEAYDISQIWHCLNCSEEWKNDIIKNIWRKNEFLEY